MHKHLCFSFPSHSVFFFILVYILQFIYFIFTFSFSVLCILYTTRFCHIFTINITKSNRMHLRLLFLLLSSSILFFCMARTLLTCTLSGRRTTNASGTFFLFFYNIENRSPQYDCNNTNNNQIYHTNTSF